MLLTDGALSPQCSLTDDELPCPFCAWQIAALSHPRVVEPKKAVLEHAVAQYAPGSPFAHGVQEWPALLRLADRLRWRRWLMLG